MIGSGSCTRCTALSLFSVVESSEGTVTINPTHPVTTATGGGEWNGMRARCEFDIGCRSKGPHTRSLTASCCSSSLLLSTLFFAPQLTHPTKTGNNNNTRYQATNTTHDKRKEEQTTYSVQAVRTSGPISIGWTEKNVVCFGGRARTHKSKNHAHKQLANLMRRNGSNDKELAVPPPSDDAHARVRGRSLTDEANWPCGLQPV